MNRTIKDATVKRYHYESHDELRQHLQLFVDAYNYGRRLKTLRGLTPYEFICQTWTKEPEHFRLDPSHHMPGPNTSPVRATGYTPSEIDGLVYGMVLWSNPAIPGRRRRART